MKIRAKKSLGQNFLIDNNILKIIVDCAEIEDKEILEALPEEAIKQLKSQGRGNNAILTMPLDPNKVRAVFYKKQDYEPLVFQWVIQF